MRVHRLRTTPRRRARGPPRSRPELRAAAAPRASVADARAPCRRAASLAPLAPDQAIAGACYSGATSASGKAHIGARRVSRGGLRSGFRRRPPSTSVRGSRFGSQRARGQIASAQALVAGQIDCVRARPGRGARLIASAQTLLTRRRGGGRRPACRGAIRGSGRRTGGRFGGIWAGTSIRRGGSCFLVEPPLRRLRHLLSS